MSQGETVQEYQRSGIPRPRRDYPTQSAGMTGRGWMKERHFHCKRCGKDHPGVDCIGMPVECFNCGKKGHRSFECQTSTREGTALEPPVVRFEDLPPVKEEEWNSTMRSGRSMSNQRLNSRHLGEKSWNQEKSPVEEDKSRGGVSSVASLVAATSRRGRSGPCLAAPGAPARLFFAVEIFLHDGLKALLEVLRRVHPNGFSSSSLLPNFTSSLFAGGKDPQGMWFLDKVNSTLLSEQTKVDGFLSPRTGNSELQMPSLLSVETLTLSDSRLPPDFPTAAPDLELENTLLPDSSKSTVLF
nr:probable serine/threonine-protein kinase clkA [Ipomoea batatas]